MNDFDRALKATLVYEGGYVWNKANPGGETNFGIMASTFWHYLSDHGQPLRSVKTITGAELRDIYQARYWVRSSRAAPGH